MSVLAGRPVRLVHTDLLDAAVTYLVAHPRASLGDIAAAAGIGRTTLFKRYATRDELEHAVAMRALDVCVAAALSTDRTAPDGGLRSLVTALIPVGPQLNFIWRIPQLDSDAAFGAAYRRLDTAIQAVLERAEGAGVLREGTPAWWRWHTLVALVYVAWECVEAGRLARLDAPDLVLATILTGVGR